ncbi:MAG: iron ABC transporter permease [Dehalococcoidia bacterium]|nr:iron ABC transporter permease [Dehalococcoidia bacterium]
MAASRALVLTGLAVALVTGCVVGVAFGTTNLEASTLLKALFTDSEDPAVDVIVRSLRAPRVVAAMVAGACLGAAGSLLQSATRNPLGDPQLFGLGGGAAIVQALALAGVVTVGPWGLTSLSVLAALAGALLIFLLASRENLTPARLALIGVSMGALTLAIAGAILTHARVFSLQALALFSGSLANRSWEDVMSAIPFLALGIVLAVLAAGRLNLLVLGDRLAGHLGAGPKTTRFMALASAGVLAGAGVALAGVVGFVGLLTPHVVRLLMGSDARTVMAVSVPTGALVVLYSDQVSRLAFMPSEIPVGLVTTVLGAPLMIWVARRIL